MTAHRIKIPLFISTYFKVSFNKNRNFIVNAQTLYSKTGYGRGKSANKYNSHDRLNCKAYDRCRCAFNVEFCVIVIVERAIKKKKNIKKSFFMMLLKKKYYLCIKIV